MVIQIECKDQDLEFIQGKNEITVKGFHSLKMVNSDKDIKKSLCDSCSDIDKDMLKRGYVWSEGTYEKIKRL